MSSTKLSVVDRKVTEVCDTVATLPMRRRLPVREILNRRMKERELSAPAIARRAEEKGVHINASTIKQILSGSTLGPNIFTCEALELGMDMPPLSLIAEFLGIKLDDLKLGQFANLAALYKELTPAQRLKADAHIDGLHLILHHIKGQPKS